MGFGWGVGGCVSVTEARDFTLVLPNVRNRGILNKKRFLEHWKVHSSWDNQEGNERDIYPNLGPCSY